MLRVLVVCGEGFLLFDHEGIRETSFRSDISLLDYDLVVLDLESVLSSYRRDPLEPYYQGLPSLDKNDSFRLREDIQRRASELSDMLSLGRAVAVITPSPTRCYAFTGRRETSGTGRNQKVTNFVELVDLAAAFPVPVKTVAAEGSNVQLRAGWPFDAFWRSTRNWLHYSAYFRSETGKPTFVITGTDRAVGAHVPLDKGVLVFVPDFGRLLLEEDEDAAWEREDGHLRAIVELVEALQSDVGDFKLPEWADRYLLPGEEDRRTALAEREAELSAMRAAISQEKEVLAKLEEWKVLFTGTGAALQKQVQAAFEALGFDVSEGPEGRDDLVLTLGKKTAVVEVKGVSKSAAEADAAQLEKWASSHLAEHGVSAKAILVVNAFKDTPFEERKKPAFPAQMIEYSTQRGHCLITGVQLLGAVFAAQQSRTKQQSVAKKIMDTVGVFEGFDDVATFMTLPSPEDTAAAS